MSAESSLQGRLNALYNIANSSYDNGTLGVIVTRHSVPNSEGFVFSITFRGNSVDGDVPSLTLAFPSTLGAQNTTDDLGAEKVALATVQNGMMGGLEFVYNQERTTCIGMKSPLNLKEKLDRLIGIETLIDTTVAHSTLAGGTFRYKIKFQIRST